MASLNWEIENIFDCAPITINEPLIDQKWLVNRENTSFLTKNQVFFDYFLKNKTFLRLVELDADSRQALIMDQISRFKTSESTS